MNSPHAQGNRGAGERSELPPEDGLRESGVPEDGVSENAAPEDAASESSVPESDAPLRLQKFLARAGVASRRHAEELIQAGRVQVNGSVVTKLGTKLNPACDTVFLDGTPVVLSRSSAAVMLYKPLGVVSTMDDPQGRTTVASLVPTKRFPGLFPVGRLDRNTTGLLLFSTDGELGHALLRPRGHVDKRYLVLVEGKPSASQLSQLCKGIRLRDGITLPAQIELLAGEQKRDAMCVLDVPPECASQVAKARVRGHAGNANGLSCLSITIHEGRNRQIRRMFQAVGHPVLALHRFAFGPLVLDKTSLARGQWRELSASELQELRGAVLE